MTVADIEARSSWLISAWNSLVTVRPEFGKLPTPARPDQRQKTIASTAVVIYGLIGAMSTMYTQHIELDVAFKLIVVEDEGNLFAWDNPVWTEGGVATPSGSGTLGTRNSFPARRAAIQILRDAMDLGTESVEWPGP